MALRKRLTGHVKQIKKKMPDDSPKVRVRKTKKSAKKSASIVDLLVQGMRIFRNRTEAMPTEWMDIAARITAHKMYYATLHIRRRKPFEEKSMSVLVSLYIFASLLYYHTDRTVMPDSDYDKLCKYLLDKFDDIPVNSVLLHNVDREGLAAGTGYHILGGLQDALSCEYLYQFYKEANDESIGSGSKKSIDIQKVRERWSAKSEQPGGRFGKARKKAVQGNNAKTVKKIRRIQRGPSNRVV